LAGIDAPPIESAAISSDEIENKTPEKVSDTSFKWTASCLQSACTITMHLMQFLSHASSGHFRANANGNGTSANYVRHGAACDTTIPMMQQSLPAAAFVNRVKRTGMGNMRSPGPNFA
jgi:hypothetical protein